MSGVSWIYVIGVHTVRRHVHIPKAFAANVDCTTTVVRSTARHIADISSYPLLLVGTANVLRPQQKLSSSYCWHETSAQQVLCAGPAMSWLHLALICRALCA